MEQERNLGVNAASSLHPMLPVAADEIGPRGLNFSRLAM
jgi:hypothetical protein